MISQSSYLPVDRVREKLGDYLRRPLERDGVVCGLCLSHGSFGLPVQLDDSKLAAGDSL